MNYHMPQWLVLGSPASVIRIKKSSLFNFHLSWSFLSWNIKFSDVIFLYYNRNARKIISTEIPFCFYPMGENSRNLFHFLPSIKIVEVDPQGDM